jgi:hypothetical protein
VVLEVVVVELAPVVVQEHQDKATMVAMVNQAVVMLRLVAEVAQVQQV